MHKTLTTAHLSLNSTFDIPKPLERCLNCILDEVPLLFRLQTSPEELSGGNSADLSRENGPLANTDTKALRILDAVTISFLEIVLQTIQ